MNIGWFSTGRDTVARNLLLYIVEQINSGKINGKIIFSFCNREPGESSESDKYHELIKFLNIDSIHLSSKRFFSSINQKENSRLLYDREVMKLLSSYKPDICLLAGYMLIVGPEMCKQYDMINLHPSPPGGPKGTWQQVIWELISKDANESGVMMHLVTPELDSGPVLTYCIYTIKNHRFAPLWAEVKSKGLERIRIEEGENNALFKTIRNEGVKREFHIIALTLEALSNHKIKIKNKQVYDQHDNLINGYDLTQTINNLLD